MDTYRRVKQQIAELERKAADLRRAEAAKVILAIKKKIEKYELQPDDLFDTRPVEKTVPAKVQHVQPAATAKPAAKYRDPASGKTWTGRGKPPTWIKDKDRDVFLISAVAKAKSEKAKKIAPAAKAAPAKKAAKTVTKKTTAKRTAVPKVAARAVTATPVNGQTDATNTGEA